VRVDIAEHYWSMIENCFHAAFAAVDDGSLFTSPGQLSVMRDTAALHFVRSLQVKRVHDESFAMPGESEGWTACAVPKPVHSR
jgi:hypothetical protein